MNDRVLEYQAKENFSDINCISIFTNTHNFYSSYRELQKQKNINEEELTKIKDVFIPYIHKLLIFFSNDNSIIELINNDSKKSQLLFLVELIKKSKSENNIDSFIMSFFYSNFNIPDIKINYSLVEEEKNILESIEKIKKLNNDDKKILISIIEFLRKLSKYKKEIETIEIFLLTKGEKDIYSLENVYMSFIEINRNPKKDKIEIYSPYSNIVLDNEGKIKESIEITLNYLKKHFLKDIDLSTYSYLINIVPTFININNKIKIDGDSFNFPICLSLFHYFISKTPFKLELGFCATGDIKIENNLLVAKEIDGEKEKTQALKNYNDLNNELPIKALFVPKDNEDAFRNALERTPKHYELTRTYIDSLNGENKIYLKPVENIFEFDFLNFYIDYINNFKNYFEELGLSKIEISSYYKNRENPYIPLSLKPLKASEVHELFNFIENLTDNSKSIFDHIDNNNNNFSFLNKETLIIPVSPNILIKDDKFREEDTFLTAHFLKDIFVTERKNNDKYKLKNKPPVPILIKLEHKEEKKDYKIDSIDIKYELSNKNDILVTEDGNFEKIIEDIKNKLFFNIQSENIKNSIFESNLNNPYTFLFIFYFEELKNLEKFPSDKIIKIINTLSKNQYSICIAPSLEIGNFIEEKITKKNK